MAIRVIRTLDSDDEYAHERANNRRNNRCFDHHVHWRHSHIRHRYGTLRMVQTTHFCQRNEAPMGVTANDEVVVFRARSSICLVRSCWGPGISGDFDLRVSCGSEGCSPCMTFS